MALSTQPYKGARDFYPEDKRLQKYMFGVMRAVCERFGYEEYDAPILEPTELYLSKGNEEIIKEQTYSFTDRGGRNITLRTEMTPTVSRMVAAKQQTLSYPLRWYSIPNCWRYERPQRGRGREFYQLNVDIFGVHSTMADYEIIQMADEILQGFGAKREAYTIRLNSRKLNDYILREYIGLNDVEATTIPRLIDRKSKIEPAEFIALLDGLLSPSHREAGASDKLLTILNAESFNTLPDNIRQHPAALNLLALQDLLLADGITNVRYDASLMRGFDYYTDVIFEVFDNHPENNRSMFGGGRYDGLMNLFGAEPMPAVGFGMGDITLQNFLELHGLMPEIRPETELYVILVGDIAERAQKVIAGLREMGVRVAVDITGKNVDKQIKSAIKKAIRFALFIGEQELADELYTLKDLVKNEEQKMSMQRVVTSIKDYRK